MIGNSTFNGREVPYKELYAGRVSTFIENLGFGLDGFELIPLKRCADLKYAR